jgi:hypothetical protein
MSSPLYHLPLHVLAWLAIIRCITCWVEGTCCSAVVLFCLSFLQMPQNILGYIGLSCHWYACVRFMFLLVYPLVLCVSVGAEAEWNFHLSRSVTSQGCHNITSDPMSWDEFDAHFSGSLVSNIRYSPWWVSEFNRWLHAMRCILHTHIWEAWSLVFSQVISEERTSPRKNTNWNFIVTVRH